jgi:hypothetical protein
VILLKVVSMKTTLTGVQALVSASHTVVMISLGAGPFLLTVMIAMLALLTLVTVKQDA